jgi:hypothetical protein
VRPRRRRRPAAVPLVDLLAFGAGDSSENDSVGQARDSWGSSSTRPVEPDLEEGGAGDRGEQHHGGDRRRRPEAAGAAAAAPRSFFFLLSLASPSPSALLFAVRLHLESDVAQREALDTIG